MKVDTIPRRRWCTAGLALLLLCFPLATACSGSDSTTETPTSTETVTRTTAAPRETERAANEANLPDLTGKDLQTAQDTAQASGFYDLASSDATGQGRFQALDRNWTVCSQTPEPGPHPTDVTVTFSVVKVGETCP